MQYFAWEGSLCRMYRDAADRLQAERWDEASKSYFACYAADVLRHGEVLGRQRALSWLRHLQKS